MNRDALKFGFGCGALMILVNIFFIAVLHFYNKQSEPKPPLDLGEGVVIKDCNFVDVDPNSEIKY